MSLDPRLLAAMQARSNAVQFSPLTNARVAASTAPRPAAPDDWGSRLAAAAQATGKVKEGPKPTGLKSTLGSVLGAVTQPLQFLDVPGRTLKSTLNEVADVFNGGDASFADWKSQIRDETFGFGDMTANTGNKWLDRGIGFVGDVALDPLTYLSFGAGKFAGSSGRLSAAAKLAAETGDFAQASKVARLGVTTADDVARETLGIGERGVRFGTKTNNVVIPGTAKLDEKVGGALGKMRAAVGDTKLGTWYRGKRSPERIAEAIEILTGRQAGDKAAAAARIYADDVMRMTEGTVAESFRGAMDQWDKLTVDERRALTHAAEKGQNAEWRAFDDALFNTLREHGATGVEYRTNHIMHSITPEFREFIKGSDDPTLKKILTVDSGESVGAAFARKFEPGGTYTFKGKTVTLQDATIEEINDKIGSVLGFKVLDDDIHSLAIKSVLATAKDSALARGIGDVIEKFPQVAERIGLDANGDLAQGAYKVGGAVDSVVDDVGTARKATAVADNWQREIDDGVADIASKTDAAHQSVKDAKQTMLDAVRKDLATLQRVDASTKRAIRAAANSVKSGHSDLVKLNEKLRKTLDGTTEKLTKVRARLTQAEAEEAAAAVQLGEDLRKAGSARRTARKKLLKELRDEEAMLASDEAALQRMIGLGQEDLADGLPDVIAQGQARVGDVEGRLAAESGPVGTDLRDQFGQVQANTDVARGAVDDAVVDQRDQLNAVLGDIGVVNDQITDGRAARTQGQQVLANVQDSIKDLKVRRDELKGVKTKARRSIDNAIDELETLARQADPNDPAAVMALQELQNAADLLIEVEQLGWGVAQQKVWRDAARKGNVTPVMHDVLRDGWNRIGKELFADEDAAFLTDELRRMFKNTVDATADGQWVKMLDEYTRFFKTYATMSPGFHFRNAMSATFMNYSDGATTGDHVEAIGLFKKLRNDPNAFDGLAPHEQDAVRAMFGSGVGGQFEAAELGELDMLGKLTNNPATRLSRKMGEWVEGPARLALALNTTKGGGDAMEALARVTRIHFDYSQMSSFDRKMKRLIPFWTFMSRNLPLQAQQMVLKPRAYSKYQHFKENFDTSEDGDIIPLKWREQGAFNTGLSFGGNDVFAAPDLPFTRLQDELEKLSDPQRLLADANPLLRVPFETLIADRKMFTGNEFYDDENKWLYALTNMTPAASQLDRLSGGKVTDLFGESTEYRKEKQAQSIASYFGLPLRELTPAVLESELRRIAREGG